jgi:hypothetical protein
MENDKNRDYGQNRNPQQHSERDSKKTTSEDDSGRLSVEKEHSVESRLNSEGSDPDVDTDEESVYKKENAT